MRKRGKNVLRYQERCCVRMKITEMNNCIEKMRECYKFDNDKTEIRLGDLHDCGTGKTVTVYTQDSNGTKIEMSRCADELVEN